MRLETWLCILIIFFTNQSGTLFFIDFLRFLIGRNVTRGHYILFPGAQDLSGLRHGSIPGAWCWPKGARPLRTRMKALVPLSLSLYRMVFVSICEHASSMFIFESTSSWLIFLASSEHFRKYRWRAASTSSTSSYFVNSVSASRNLSFINRKRCFATGNS